MAPKNRGWRRRLGIAIMSLFLCVCSGPVSGWKNIDGDYGWVWEYHAVRGGSTILVVARCEYTGMRVRGVYLWNGTYYYKHRDFSGESPGFDDYYRGENLNGLEGCVQWAQDMMAGDYYI